MKFTAVAFDLDGTLYPSFRMYSRLLPFFLKEHRLLRAMGKARAILRKPSENLSGHCGDFYEVQARLMAETLGEPPEKVRQRTEKLIYRGWEPIFKKIRLFPHVRETLDAFREKGIKLGLLSDFPPDIKLKYMKLSHYWDVSLCSEVIGRLKPDPLSFLETARKLDTPPQQILYVGNKAAYDAAGARKAGMKAALILPRWNKLSAPSKRDIADFVFYDYRQLRNYVLG